MKLTLPLFYGPVGWNCRIHRLHLCWGVRSPPTSVQDMTLNNQMVKFQYCRSFEYPLIVIAPRARVVTPDRVLSMGQIERNRGFESLLFLLLNCILLLNWIARNRTVLTGKLHTFAKLNCLKWNGFFTLKLYYAKLNCSK